MNKKIIFVILLFIGISFVVYSFANPLTPDDEKLQNDTNYNDSFEDDFDDLEQNIDDEEQDKEDENDEIADSEDVTEEVPVLDTTTNTSSNSGSATKKVTYSYRTPVTLIPSNVPSVTTSQTVTTPQVTQPAPTQPQTPVQTTPTPTPVPTEASFGFEAPVGDGLNGNKITITKTGNTITLSGTMEKQPENYGITSGSYVVLKIVAPKILSETELANFSMSRTEYNDTHTKSILDVGADGKQYFELVQMFQSEAGDTFHIVVNWGNGSIVEYKIICNIKVI